MNKLYHKRHPDFEQYDRITIEAVPRYKTSGLSGDEWRMSALVTFYFKGEVVKQQTFGDMKWAATLLMSAWIGDESGIPNHVLQHEEQKCDQPSCCNDATKFYKLRETYSAHGERLDPTDSSLRYFRKFCDQHKTRGDCGREDSDLNYEEIAKP